MRCPKVKPRSGVNSSDLTTDQVMTANEIVLRDEKDCRAKTQELELKIRRVEGLSAVLIQEQPGWVAMAKRYVAWYEGVEGVIKTMLSCLGIEIVSVRNSQGNHVHHEKILEELAQPLNPLFFLLGRDDVLFQLRQAKDDRNVMSGLGKGSVFAGPPPDWNAFAARIRGIERALWASLCYFSGEYGRRKQYDRFIGSEKQLLVDWETNLHVEMQKLEDQKAYLIEEEQRLESQEQKHADMKHNKALDEEELKNEAAHQKKLTAALSKERKAQEDAIKKAKADLAQQEKQTQESAKQLKTKTQLNKDIEKLKDTIREVRNDRDPKVKSMKAELEAKDHAQVAEVVRLKEAHKRELKDQLSFCAKNFAKEKDAFRKALNKMREADATIAKAELAVKEQHQIEELEQLGASHRNQIEATETAHKDEIEGLRRIHCHTVLMLETKLEAYKEVHEDMKRLVECYRQESAAKEQDYNDELERMKRLIKSHHDVLEAKDQAHKDELESLKQVHLTALEAQYYALEKEFERIKEAHQQTLNNLAIGRTRFGNWHLANVSEASQRLMRSPGLLLLSALVIGWWLTIIISHF